MEIKTLSSSEAKGKVADKRDENDNPEKKKGSFDGHGGEILAFLRESDKVLAERDWFCQEGA